MLFYVSLVIVKRFVPLFHLGKSDFGKDCVALPEVAAEEPLEAQVVDLDESVGGVLCEFAGFGGQQLRVVPRRNNVEKLRRWMERLRPGAGGQVEHGGAVVVRDVFD